MVGRYGVIRRVPDTNIHLHFGQGRESMSSRAASPRVSRRQPAMLLQASVTLIVLFECATAFVPVGLRLPSSSLHQRAVDRIQSQKARAGYNGMSRLSTIRMSPDMLQAEPEGSVEPPMELASPPSLAGPPVRPTAPAPEEKKEEPRAAAPAPSFATAGSPVAPPPAVEKEAPAPAPAAPEVWTYPETFGWVKEEKGVTPADVHITQCGKCRAQYAIDLDQLGDEGKKVQCAVCNHVWFQSPMKLEELPAGIEFKKYPMEDYKEHARQVAERRAEDGDSGRGGGRGGPRRSGACTLFVGNLPFSLTEDTLRNVFSPYGNVVSASIICDQETGKPRGFGFVDFDDLEDGKEAMEMVNGMTVEGRQLAVNLSEDKRGGGGGGGRGRGGDRGGRGRGRGGGAPRGRSDGRDADGKFIIRKRGE